MPRAKSRPKTKSAAKPRVAALRLKKTQVKSTRAKSPKRQRRVLNGIPLKRKVVWTYDTDSPEFKAAWERDMQKIRATNADRDGMQFIEAVLDDPDVQKWWR